MFTTSLLVAGAIAFCSGDPAEPRCTETPVTAVTLTAEHRATIDRLAEEARQGVAYSRERGITDEWRASQRGDCEDALLWAAAELRRVHPALANAYRFVAVQQGWDHAGTRRVRRMHLILVVEGDSGRVVLDTQFGRVRAWADYAHLPAFTASGSIAGQWQPWS